MLQSHLELLRVFLAHRKDVVEQLQVVLNAQREPVEFLKDRALLSRLIEDCFFMGAALSDNQSRLRGQLQEAYMASGFRPRQMPELFNDLINPAEMMIRGFFCWQQTRWPGRNGRVRYAQTLFNLYFIRSLVLASLRLWDTVPSSAGERLAEIQLLLDELWKSSPSDQPVLVRDARWLIPLAQSPTTDELSAYFEVAEHVRETLNEADRIEIQTAHIRMIGGHLTSQIRHYCMQDGVTLNENSVALRTRMSNALDFALLIQNLVPLLEVYERAVDSGDSEQRLILAGAICQGISADPELFLNRVNLLGALSLIEHLFVAIDSDGQAGYTPKGQRHIQFFTEYSELVSGLAEPLREDFLHLKPVDGTYSPYGAIFGTPTNLIEDIALRALQRDAATKLGLEDVFSNGGADRLSWINGWRKLPHVDREVQKLYEYPQQFAVEIYDRIEEALANSIAHGDENSELGTGRLYIVTEEEQAANSTVSQIPDLPIRYFGSTDESLVAEGKAVAYDPARLLRDRQEGYFVLSFETSGGWVGLKKDMLTEVLGQGSDAKVVGLSASAARALTLMCPGLVAPIGR